MLRHSRDAQANTGIRAEAEPHIGVMECLQVLLIDGDGGSTFLGGPAPVGLTDRPPAPVRSTEAIRREDLPALRRKGAGGHLAGD
jgi:hypothetical protein